MGDFPGSLSSSIERRMAGGSDSKTETETTYTVLSYIAITLWMLFAVELLRSALDRAAKHRVFFTVVLDVFYHEVFTLGIVEFVIYMLHKFSKLGLDNEDLFVDVHFALFFTALLNGIQCVLFRATTTYVSNRMWVRTEDLDLNCYLAIRKEFDSVQAEMVKLDTKHRKSIEKVDALAEEVNILEPRHIWHDISRRFKNPLLVRKYNRLLVQVRFHELRVHFLKSNKLPSKFRVSDYLQKCELHLFIKLMHISAFTWFTMMVFINLLHFVVVIAAWVSLDEEAAFTAVSLVLLCGLSVFGLMSYIILLRTKWIFSRIMHTKLIDFSNVVSDDDSDTRTDVLDDNKQFSQSDLFLGGNVNTILFIVQMIQFCYSFIGGLMIVLNTDDKYLAGRGHKYENTVYIIYAISYSVFLVASTFLIPRYTLCVSLGQLVNMKTLRECLALFRREEALRKQASKLDEGERMKAAFESYQMSIMVNQSSKGLEIYDDGRDDDSVESEIDDVPKPRQIEKKGENPPNAPTLFEKLHSMLLTGNYRFASGVCGTMVCFFLVVLRMEALLHERLGGIIFDEVGSSDSSSLFWTEVVWLIMFILESILICFIFFPHATRLANMPMFITGISDFMLSVTCLALLLSSEALRSGGVFGSRTGDGLGKIEPFTSLILLRMVRFPWGYQMSKFLKRLNMVPGHDMHQTADKHDHVSDRSSGSTTNLKKMLMEKATIVELWQKAIGLYPDIVDKHGEFSSELLQAMLGIPIVHSRPDQELVRDGFSDSSHNNGDQDVSQNDDSVHDSETSPAISSTRHMNESDFESSLCNVSFMSGGRCTDLSPDAQAVICSARVGKSMRSSIKGHQEIGSNEGQENINTSINKRTEEKDESSQPGKLKFELDNIEEENHDDIDDPIAVFIAPNAPLIRRMRRCERRLPPYLDRWAVVDVVMTKYELVYFEVSLAEDVGEDNGRVIKGYAQPIDNLDITSESTEFDENTRILLKKKAVDDVLVATHGGKSLRLLDVAIGRTIVGHVDLSDVSCVKVDRYLVKEKRIAKHEMERKDEGNILVNKEYWKVDKEKTTANYSEESILQSLQERFDRIQEDQLKIDSSQGALYLRFLIDLEHTELHDNKGDIALLWCQTIARLCGIDQLHQELPHYGEQGSNELIDYLEIHESYDGRGGSHPKKKWNLLKE